MQWEALENGEPLSDDRYDGQRKNHFGLKEYVREVIMGREGFAPEEGKLSWENFEDEVHELWWLPYDHSPSVDLHIRIKERYVE